MVFSSTFFLFIFFPLLLLVYWISNKINPKYRNIVLLIFSIVFYAWGEPIFVFVMLGSIFFNYFVAIKISSGKKAKWWLVLSVAENIGLLFVFKYLGFSLENLGILFPRANIKVVSIVLPLGISFFTFQIMSYVFDVYYQKVSVQKSFCKLALYVTMFPQLVAGPIVRYEQIEKEIDERKESEEDFAVGIIRFVYGLAKKVLIADYVAVIADNMFYISKNSELSIMGAWLGAIAYTLQIYFDFSGYSDMAIGLGRIFGFHFGENFNFPYMAKSVTDFWRRWHISLSSWFRDYVYIPLGGSYKGRTRMYINLFIVWTLTGIWHGANWTFVVWGMLYFIVLSVEKALKLQGGSWWGRIYTLLVAIVCWVIFRAENLSLAWKYIGEMFGSGKKIWDADAISVIKGSGLILAVAILLCTPIFEVIIRKCDISERTVKNIKSIIAIPLFILCIASSLTSTYSPFIYFNF